MQHCLYHPTYGYYTRQQAIGRTADFITAPCITNLFGHTLAVWVVQQWEKLGSPPHWQLIEGGAGQGQLMLDVCTALQKMAPSAYQNMQLYILETSPAMQQRQQKLLAGYNIQWLTAPHHIPDDKPTLFFANELLDAFPVQQHCGDKERQIVLHNDNFAFSCQDNVVEYPAQMITFLEQLKPKISAGLFIDYGTDEEIQGDTLQAVQNHKKVDFFHQPGATDLTTQVQFSQVQKTLGPAATTFTTQADFLLQHGLALLAENSLRHAAAPERENIEQAIERLIHPAQMGQRFKTLTFVRD